MTGPAPALGGGLIAPGSGGGFCDPSTDTTDPAAPPSGCGGAPPTSGGSGNCDIGGTCSSGGAYQGGAGGGNYWGGGGSGDGSGDALGTMYIMTGLGANSSCGSPDTCSATSGGGRGGAGGGAGRASGRTYIQGGGAFSGGADHRYYILGDLPCDSPPGGPVPPPVPSSGLSCNVGIKDQSTFFVRGLPIRCAETGVTLTSACSALQFFLPSFGPFNFSTPGGAGIQCAPTPHGFSYPAGSQSGFAMNTILIMLIHS